MGESNLSAYNCPALIQKLNAVVASGDDKETNSEHLSNSPSTRTKMLILKKILIGLMS
jgi:hypothetical protein